MAAQRKRIVFNTIADDGADITFDILGPPNADGKQEVVDTVTYAFASVPANRAQWFALHGIAAVVSNRYRALDDDATPADVRASIEGTLSTITAGTWEPGRTFAERAPTDLELAIAEATNTPIADLLNRIENEVQLNADGTPKLDARGRKMRVFTQRVLDGLKDDPAVRPIYARLLAERAKRESAAAKAGGGTSKLSGLFASPQPVETAAAAQ